MAITEHDYYLMEDNRTIHKAQCVQNHTQSTAKPTQ